MINFQGYVYVKHNATQESALGKTVKDAEEKKFLITWDRTIQRLQLLHSALQNVIN